MLETAIQSFAPVGVANIVVPSEGNERSSSLRINAVQSPSEECAVNSPSVEPILQAVPFPLAVIWYSRSLFS